MGGNNYENQPDNTPSVDIPEPTSQVNDAHQEMIQEMNDMVNILTKKLGAESSVTKKMKQVFEILSSLTDEEVEVMDMAFLEESIESHIPDANL